MKVNIYWQVYRNLEREFLTLTEFIHIDDHQLENVYSMRIADLLLRTVVEIESISKHLYLQNGGQKTDSKKIYFDTDCMAYLNDCWCLESKLVQVVSPDLYLDKSENRVLAPLKDAQFRSPKSPDWNQAYQAIKHDRAESLVQYGRLIYLLKAMAALYVLNLYNRNEQYLGYDESFVSSVDLSFGSSLFSVKMHRIYGFPNDGHYVVSSYYDNCVYIQDYEPSSRQAAIEVIKELKQKMAEITLPKLTEKVQQLIDAGEQPDLSQESISKIRNEIMQKEKVFEQAGLQLNRLGKLQQILNIRYNVVLNKRQYSIKSQA